METMPQRIEKALADAIRDNPDRMAPHNGPNAGPLGLNLRAFANVAIEALREPTSAMLDAGADHVGYQGDAGDEGRVWEAMIDAALTAAPKETP